MSKPRRSRLWIGFFAVLFLLATTAVTLELWFSHYQQLTPDRLARAHTAWADGGSRDYDLTYTVTWQRREGEDRLRAEVRRDRIVSIEKNGQLLDPSLYAFTDLQPLLEEVEQSAESGREDRTVEAAERRQATATFVVQVREGRLRAASRDGTPLLPEVADSYGMTALLAGVSRFLEQDEHAASRPYVVAAFDVHDGHLLRYVRISSRPHERLEWNLREYQARRPEPRPG